MLYNLSSSGFSHAYVTLFSMVNKDRVWYVGRKKQGHVVTLTASLLQLVGDRP